MGVEQGFVDREAYDLFLAQSSEEDLDYAMLDMVNARFHRMAQKIGTREGIAVGDAFENVWRLFEDGLLELVMTGDSRLPVNVAPCGADQAKRREAADQNRRLVEFRRRLMQQGAQVLT